MFANICRYLKITSVSEVLSNHTRFHAYLSFKRIMFHRFRDYQKRPRSPIKLIKFTWFNYTESTSIHGLNYTTDLSLVRKRRVSWGLVFGIFSSLAIFLIVRAYNDWQDNPVITSIQSTGRIGLIYLLTRKKVCNLVCTLVREVYSTHDISSHYYLQSRVD